MSLDVNISEPDEFNCVELHSCIENVARIKDIKDFSYHVDYVCGKGENYIANVFRVLIKETEKDNTISVIVKTLINTTRQELFRELHKREVDAYENIINKYVKIQNDVVDKIVLPKHILSSTIKGNEVIILEDLLLDGFKIDEKLKREQIDYNSVQTIVTKLAKFHALTFVLENSDGFSDVMDRTRKLFDDILYKDTFLSKTRLKDHYTESFEISLNLIDNADARKQLEHVKSKLLEILKFYTKPRKHNVFCHGDLWINNILLKNQENDKEVCFVDFQTMRYASPVTDFLYFMYMCTDSEFRQNHYDQLKTEYYESFACFLKEFNIESSTVYSKEAFHDDIEEITPYGLVIALIELRITTTKPEDEFLLRNILKVDRDKDLEPLALYHSRVNDVVNESVRSGVLDKLLDVLRGLYNLTKVE